MSKKNYTSPLFEEVVLMTEDVLSSSPDVEDNLANGDKVGEGDVGVDDFDF